MFLGTTVDGFFPIKCPVSLSDSRDSRVAYHDAADGGRSATIFGGLSPARSWDVGYGSVAPAEMEIVESMSERIDWYRRGSGLQFLQPGGERVNMLSREESGLTYSAKYMSAPVKTREGFAFGYFAGASDTSDRSLVVAQMPVDATSGPKTYRLSAYVRGTSTARVWLNDASASGATSIDITLKGGESGMFTRDSATFTTKDNTRFVEIEFTGEMTKPAVTLGDALYPWGPGQRVKSVVIEQQGTELIRATSDGRDAQTLIKPTYRIMELRTGDPL